jgi:translocation and assembly module TamB
MSEQPDVPEQSSPPAPVRRRWPIALVAMLVCLMACAVWLTASVTGFAMLWRAAAACSGGALSVGQVRGTLWQGFSFADVRLETKGMTASVDHIAIAWEPAALWHRTLHVRRIAIGSVRLAPRSSAPASAPPKLPSSLSLPLDVRIDSLTVQAVTLSSGDFALYDLGLDYAYQQARHRVRLQGVRLPQGTLSGSATIEDSAPFAVRGSLGGKADAGSGMLQIGGSLQALQLHGRVRATPVEIDLDGRFAPFAAQPFDRVERLDLRTRDIDPHSILAHWPRAAFDLDVHIEPDGRGGARGGVQLQNRLPGALSAGRVPVSGLRAAFRFDAGRFDLSSLLVQLPAGSISMQGHLDQNGSELSARLNRVGLRALDASAPDDIVQGSLALKGRLSAPSLHVALQGGKLAADVDLDLHHLPSGQWSVAMPRGRLGIGGGRLDLSGVLDEKRAFVLRGRLVRLNPHDAMPSWPQADINATLQASGSLASPLRAALNLDITPSRLSGAPLGGEVRLQLAGGRLSRVQADLDLAGNRIKAQGAWGAPGDHLQLALDAPALARIGFGLSGSMRGRFDLSGQPASPRLLVDIKGQQLGLPGRLSIQSVNLTGDVHEGGAGRVQAQLAVQGARGDGWRADSLLLRLAGTQSNHVMDAEGRLQVAAQPYRVGVQLTGGWNAARGLWRGSLQRLQVDGAPGLRLLGPTMLSAGRDGISLGPTHLEVAGGQLSLETLTRRPDGKIVSRGRLDGLALAALKPWLDLPEARSLVLGASWTAGADGRGSLIVERQRGDFVPDAPAGSRPLGLERARVQLDWGAGQTRFVVDAGAHRATAHADGSIAAMPWQIRANSPLAGRLQLNVPNLSELAVASGLQVEAGGSLMADVRVSGPLMQLQAHGNLNGHNLLWRDRKTGVRLSGGELAARLDGRTLLLDKLRFVSGEGDATASGRIDMHGTVPTAAIRVEIRHFNVFDRPDRRLVVSGAANFSLSDKLIALSGLVRADEGRLTLPKTGTPALSDDVVVIGRPVEQSSLASLPVQVDLVLDLGKRFTFEAPGLSVKLSGQVQVKAHPGEPPTARGVVKVVKGSYKAYGQELDIKSGSITFVGPLDNPNLDIRATRRLSSVGAGVEVTGSVSAPKLQLIADESLSERDKLAWLVLGHAADDNAQDNNFLALAASQMAAGSINDKIGLFDDVGLSRKQSKALLNGTVSPAEQVLTVGKQLTRTFYLGYEYGLTSSQQALKVIYRLSRGWSLLLRVGTNTSVESRYTVRFD